MVYKRVSKIIFAAILAVTVFSGCGNRQEEGIDKTETETTKAHRIPHRMLRRKRKRKQNIRPSLRMEK